MKTDDLVGKQFGNLTVKGYAGKDHRGIRHWLCICRCGNEVSATKYNLVHGITRSCRCLGRFKDLSGKKFGRLMVIGRAITAPGKVMWLCSCECGKKCTVAGCNLRSGNTVSCGCAKRKYEDRTQPLLNIVYHGYVKGAKARGLPFELEKLYFFKLIQKPCHYCNYTAEFHNGIDRVDNEKGYTKDNCVPCCSVCNNAKKNHSLDEFLSWGLRLSNWLKTHEISIPHAQSMYKFFVTP